VVLYVGRVCNQKGSDVLLEAVRALHERRSDLQLVIAGPVGQFGMKADPDLWVERIKGVGGVYLGAVEESRIAAIYNLTDVFVMPTRIAEAQACGKPFVANDCGGLREVVPTNCGGRFNRIGYDTDRGRLDKTHHPFCSKFSLGDIGITTRVNETQFGSALFAAMHEAGHAIYEQGVAPALGAHRLEQELHGAYTGASCGFEKIVIGRGPRVSDRWAESEHASATAAWRRLAWCPIDREVVPSKDVFHRDFGEVRA
jgi:hypothetical protein